ncbi:MAG: ankyrin repeat domain-containing protein [Limnohabitans sp.]|nr:ankyrin repeat domain-containing protein [Limnohabitans sp.]
MIFLRHFKIFYLILMSMLFFSCGKEKNKKTINNKKQKTEKQISFTYTKLASTVKYHIVDGDYEYVERFLKKGGDPNLRCKGYLRAGREIPETKFTDENWTLLMVAIFNREYKIAKLLLDNKADVNAKNAVGHTALFLACAHNEEDAIKLLLQYDANVQDSGEDPSGTTALHWAVNYDLNEIVLEFLKRGADVNTYCKEVDRTILMSAFFSDSIRPEVVNKIIDAGADLSFKTKDNETTLMYACRDNNLEAVKKILAKKIDVNAESKNRWQTALCEAAGNKSRDLSVLKLLIANGAKVNIPDNRGRSPLTEAVFSWNLEKVKYLVEKGADINRRCEDFGGASPLLEAAEWAKGDKVDEIIKYLVEKGADVNISNEWGESVLHKAIASDRNYNTIAYLIEKGADIDYYDNNKLTPLMKAARNNAPKIVELLLEHSARLDLVDDQNRTALTHAKETAERTGEDSVLKLIEYYERKK